MELNRTLVAADDEDLRALAAILDTAAQKLNGTVDWDTDDITHLAEYYQVEPTAFARLRAYRSC